MAKPGWQNPTRNRGFNQQYTPPTQEQEDTPMPPDPGFDTTGAQQGGYTGPTFGGGGGLPWDYGNPANAPGVDVGGMPDWMLGENPVGFDWSDYFYGGEDWQGGQEGAFPGWATPWAYDEWFGPGGNTGEGSMYPFGPGAGFGPGGTPSQWGAFPEWYEQWGSGEAGGNPYYPGFAWGSTQPPWQGGGLGDMGSSDFNAPFIFDQMGWYWPTMPGNEGSQSNTEQYGWYGVDWLDPNQNLFLEPGNWDAGAWGEWGWDEGQTNWGNMGAEEWLDILNQAGMGGWYDAPPGPGGDLTQGGLPQRNMPQRRI